jgi:hypothetical protein
MLYLHSYIHLTNLCLASDDGRLWLELVAINKRNTKPHFLMYVCVIMYLMTCRNKERNANIYEDLDKELARKK